MMAEFDERELERLLVVAAEAVEVPDDGPAAVLQFARRGSTAGVEAVHACHDRRFVQRTLAAAAAIIVIVGVAVAALGHGSGSSSKASDRFVQAATPDTARPREATPSTPSVARRRARRSQAAARRTSGCRRSTMRSRCRARPTRPSTATPSRPRPRRCRRRRRRPGRLIRPRSWPLAIRCWRCRRVRCRRPRPV